MDEVIGPDSRRWIDEHEDYLYRVALVRVYDSNVAEDLVQDTFLAALQGTRRESGPTAERRWMVGIIKHKIVDHFRRMSREPLRDDSHIVREDKHRNLGFQMKPRSASAERSTRPIRELALIGSSD